MIIVPFILIFLFKEQLSKKYKICIPILIFSLSILLKIPQNIALENEFAIPKRHTIQCFNRLVYTPLLLSDSKDDKEALEGINKIFSVSEYKKATSLEEADSIAAKTLQSGITKSDVNDYVKGCLILILHHPKEYFMQQLNTFLNASSIKNEILNTQNSADMFEYDDTYLLYNQLQFIKNDSVFFKPINNLLRKYTINVLEGREKDNWHTTIISHKIFWNLVPPLMVLVLSFIYSIYLFFKKKNMFFIGIIVMVLSRAPILFLTAPYAQFMYWFRFYIIGYSMLIFYIIVLISKVKKRRIL